MLAMTKHCVGRGSESRFLNIKNFTYNSFHDCLDPLWTEQKTLKTYACPFVPNKDGYTTEVYHALGCYFVCGKGLYRTPSGSGKIDSHLIPHITRMAGSNVSHWLTVAI